MIYLLVKPFCREETGRDEGGSISCAVEHGDLKGAAADLTLLADEALENAIRQSKDESAGLEAEANQQPA